MLLLDWLQCQWTTTDSLLQSLEKHSLVRIRTCVCTYVCECNRESWREDLPIDGNKLTSCRKLANVPWEDSSGERVATMREGVREKFPAGEEEQEMLLPEMRIRLSKTTKTLFEIYYSWRSFVINAQFWGRTTNVNRKRSRKGQKAHSVLFRKSCVAFH